MANSTDVDRLVASDFKLLKLNGRVGFDSLPDQLVAKTVARGFAFNILSIGETGLGKTTLMETLFNRKFEDFTESTHECGEVELEAHTYDLEEKNVKLKVTLVETRGYGDQIDKSNSTDKILEYIDLQNDLYLQEEMKIKRDLLNYHDTRIHVCLYFIAPTGHSLKSVDLLALKRLQKKVNVVPVIAKSDVLMRDDLKVFKERIMNELKLENIEYYRFPCDDDQFSDKNAKMNETYENEIPFAIVGSLEEVRSSSTAITSTGKLRGRTYPWGTVIVDSDEHCDFNKLRDMILRVNMEDLREKTHQCHYESYRQQRMLAMGFKDDESVPLKEVYLKRKENQRKEQMAKEEEMRQTFVQRVKQKEEELKEKEKMLNAKFDSLRKQHNEAKADLDLRNKKLMEEREIHERRKSQYEKSLQQLNAGGGGGGTIKPNKKK